MVILWGVLLVMYGFELVSVPQVREYRESLYVLAGSLRWPLRCGNAIHLARKGSMTSRHHARTALDSGGVSSPKLIQIPLGDALPLPAHLARLVEASLEKLLSIDRINEFHAALYDAACGERFFDHALEILKVSCRLSDADRGKIPATGPLITVANHPFGGIEGILLGKILTDVRRDVKILGNYLLQRIPQLCGQHHSPERIRQQGFGPGQCRRLPSGGEMGSERRGADHLPRG